MRRIQRTWVMWLLTLVMGCQGGGDDGWLVAVDDEKIGATEVEMLQANLTEDLQPTTTGEEAIRELLVSLVDGEIMILEALALGLDSDPMVSGPLSRAASKEIREQVWSSELGDLAVTEEEFKTAYETGGWNRRVRLAHITTATKAEALEVIELLHGGAKFGDIARERSLAPDREMGGDLGRYLGPRDGNSELMITALALAEGEVGGPLRGRHGFEVITAIEVVEVEFEQVEEKIRVALRDEKTAAARRALLEKLERELGVQYSGPGVRALLATIADTSARSVTEIEEPLVRFSKGGGISVAEASQRLFRRRVPLQGLTDSVDVAGALRHWLLADTLLVARGMEKELDETAEFRSFIDSERRRLLVNQLRKHQVIDRIQLTDEELEEQYEKDKNEFVVQAQIEVVEILTRAEEEAERLLQQVRDGADMAELARNHTVRSSAARSDGHLHIGIEDGEEKWGPLFAVAETSEVGSLVGPIAVDGGYSILRIKKRLPERLRMFDELRDVIHHRVKRRRMAEDFGIYMTGLRKRYANRIRWNDAAIEALAAQRERGRGHEQEAF